MIQLSVMMISMFATAALLYGSSLAIKPDGPQPTLIRDHTRESTTPESWAAMNAAIAKALHRAVPWYVATGLLGLMIGVAFSSATLGFAGAALVGVVGVIPMVIGLLRAKDLLEPHRPDPQR